MPIDGNIEAVVCRMCKMIGVTRRVPHDFLRHTADIDAGAAKRPMLNDTNSRTILCRSSCVGDTTAATADYKEIKSIKHLLSPSSMFKNLC